MTRPNGVIVPLARSFLDYDPQTSSAQTFLEEHPGLVATLRRIVLHDYCGLSEETAECVEWRVLWDCRLGSKAIEDDFLLQMGDLAPDNWDDFIFILFTPPIEEPNGH